MQSGRNFLAIRKDLPPPYSGSRSKTSDQPTRNNYALFAGSLILYNTSTLEMEAMSKLLLQDYNALSEQG
jgi:hypothetical protein